MLFVVAVGALGIYVLTRPPVTYARVFPEAMAEAWVRHNVEEVGVLEHLLPEALRQRPDEAARLALTP